MRGNPKSERHLLENWKALKPVYDPAWQASDDVISNLSVDRIEARRGRAPTPYPEAARLE